MIITHSSPKTDGYHMPAEFEPHAGCIIIWPQRPGSWSFGAVAARRAFTEVIRQIAKSETVFVACGKRHFEQAQEQLAGITNVRLLELETDDSWARDIGPTFVVRDTAAGRAVRCVNWSFNAWGGTYDGLYASWAKDDAFAKAFAAQEGFSVYDAVPFVLEGGSVHTDGEGTAIVTSACLLSPGRNPKLAKGAIEARLKEYLGVDRVIWLPRGIYNDETNEHVDNVCAFIRPGEVVLAWTDNKDDPQYELSLADFEVLEKAEDARGRRLKVHKLPIPDVPVLIEASELAGFTFEEGEDVREAGERLSASYVNFYFANGSILLPAFGGANATSDRRAYEILSRLCPERPVVQIAARAILAGGGNIHCITQQIPEGVKL